MHFFRYKRCVKRAPMMYLIKLEDLEIVREFGAPCVTGIHCDGHKTVGVEFQHGSFKVKILQVHLNSPLDAEDLLGHDRQDLKLNTVEFVKASPRSRRS